MSFTLAELVSTTSGELVPASAPADAVLERLVIDSRQAGPGALFVALAGETSDGHLYLNQAADAGASVLMVQRGRARALPDPVQVVVADTRRALADFTRGRLAATGVRVVGVTGSVGKTTTKDLLASVLSRRFGVLKTEGNLNTYTGFPMTIARLSPGHEVFVAEFAMSAPGEIAFLCEMAPPEVAVVLNVGLSHLGMLGSVEAIAAAKRELVEGLRDGGTAVLNADDPRVAAMAEAAQRVVTFGIETEGADVRAEAIELQGLDGSVFTLVLPDRSLRARIRIAGDRAVLNALAAAAAGVVMGVPAEDIAAGLEACPPPPGRMAVRPGRLGATIIDDSYNASPASMAAALAVLVASPARPRVAVLGDMLELGEAAASAHRGVGRDAAAVELLVAVGEYAEQIAAGAVAAGLDRHRVETVATASEAIAVVEAQLRGAVVLVKGSRGVALEQVVEALVES